MENRNWIRPECARCPYFVNGREDGIIQCVRPKGEECLAEEMLIKMYLELKNSKRRPKNESTNKKQFRTNEYLR